MDSLILQDKRIIEKMDELTKGFTQDDIELLKEILSQNAGDEIS